jgi:hypothetical protein
MMTTEENPTLPITTAADFAVILDNCEKLNLLEIEGDITGFNPTLHVVDESEHRYGEPGTLILVALAGGPALPFVLLWLANHAKGFTLSEDAEVTLSYGTTLKSSLRVIATESVPQSFEQLRELSKFLGVDPDKIAAAYRLNPRRRPAPFIRSLCPHAPGSIQSQMSFARAAWSCDGTYVVFCWGLGRHTRFSLSSTN